MAKGKNKPDTPPGERSMREGAEEQLARVPNGSADLKGQTPEQLIHELQVHQIELEMQAEELRRAQFALKESRDKFLDLYDFAPTGYLTLTDKTLIAEVNLAGATLLGVERSTLIRAPFSKFMSESDADSWHRYFVNLLRQEEKQTCTLTLKRSNGSTFPARLEGLRLTGSDGVITANIAISDITDIWQIAALRDSEEKYRALFAAESDGIFVVDKETGIIIDCNDAITPMYGYLKDEVIGQPNTVVSAEPDATRAATKKVKGIIPIRYHKRKDGSIFPVEITANVILINGRDVIVAAVRDISDKKLAQDALQASELQYRRLFETAQDGILILDEETGTIIDVNTFLIDMLGYPLEYFVGKHLWEVGFIKDKSLAQNAFTELKTKGYIRYEDLPLETIDGRSIDVEFISNVYPVNHHKIIQCNIRDITARKYAENALALASKKLTLLSGITRHDINNQLLTLNGFLGILQRKVPDPTLEEFFTKITKASERIASMIRFTKEYEKIGVNAPIWKDCRTIVETATKQAPLGKVIVKNDLPSGAEVFADPLIFKVFYNLMDNAARYGGKITTIRFSVDERDGSQIIVCEDDGDGVVAEEKERIFDRGFGKNTGLGLALAREILDITGITIRETGVPGIGARFEMTVPKGAWRSAGKGP
jgi:PAS domain S-box-containing protein